MSERDWLIGEIGQSLRTVAHALGSSTTPEWLGLDLTITQIKALMATAASGPLSIGSLAKHLGVHLSAASHVADRLVQTGLIERYEDSEDRRRTFIRLSPTGRTLMGQLWQGRHDRLHAWIGALGDDDLVALRRGLSALAAVVPAEGAFACCNPEGSREDPSRASPD